MKGSQVGRVLGAAANAAKADAFAKQMRLIFDELAGLSASAAARELERRGYATARGGKWSAARHQDPPAAGGLTLVVRIAISAEAFAAISATLPLGSVSYENKTNDRGERKPPAPTPCSGSLCSPPFSYGRRFT